MASCQKEGTALQQADRGEEEEHDGPHCLRLN